MLFYIVVGMFLLRAVSGWLDGGGPPIPRVPKLAAPPSFEEVEAQLAALPYQVAGPHYDLRSDVSLEMAEESLLRLEDGVRHLQERWPDHPRPTEPFLVNLLDDPHLYQDAWRANWPGRPTSDGFFDEVSGQAFLLHDTPNETRRLLLHEAVHQYHFALMGPDRWDRLPPWYVEGSAHELEYGSTEQHPDAVSHLRMVHGEITDLLSLPTLVSPDWSYAADSSARRRAIGFALVKFFRRTDVPEYREWFRAFEQPDFRFDHLSPKVLAAFDRDALRDHWLRFERELARSLPSAGTWQDRGGSLEATPDRGHQAFRLWPAPGVGTAVTVSYRVPWPLPAGVHVGFVYSGHNVLNHRVLEWSGRELALRLFRSGWTTRDEIPLLADSAAVRADPGSVLLTLHVDPARIRLDIEGAGSWEAPSVPEDEGTAVGLWMRARNWERAKFLDVQYETRPAGR